MHLPPSVFQKMILETGLVSAQDLERLQEEAERSGEELVQLLVTQEIIPERYLTEFLGTYLAVPVVDLKKGDLDREIIRHLPESLAEQYRLVVFDRKELEGGRMQYKVAMEDPLDLTAIELLKERLDGELLVHLIAPSSLQAALHQYKQEIGEDFDKIIKENLEKSHKAGYSSEAAAEHLGEEVPIVAIFETILRYAASLNASDIHLEPEPKKLLVRFRVDGILRDITTLPGVLHQALVARVKILANLQIDEHRAPQDGRFNFNAEDKRISARVSVMPTFYGEKVVVRLLVSSGKAYGLGELGYSERAGSLVEENIKKTHGMILATGPTGSGKTTSLYAILHILNTPEVNICTVEDPIEYDVIRVNQTQVNPKAGITFATGLRSLLRQNPDILMVGEIRDKETLDISVHAALTGHILLSTLHTNDAPSTIPRLIDMGAEPFLLASTLNLVIAQRLVRRACVSCITSFKPPEEIVQVIKAQFRLLHPDREPTIPSLIYKGRGCKVCSNTGYSGQMGIFEVMQVTPKIRELITRKVSAERIREEAINGGMGTMFEDGMHKVESGATTVEEVLRAIRE